MFRTQRPKTLLLLLSMLALVCGLWLGWEANSFLAQDACLDRGGAWDYELRSCDRPDRD